ncbi:ribonucleoside-diphosphate reductase subunit alpha [Candidatus Woesearchaeota archaeon]|nr:ribonucleoside-diphosphate reductase subunit alpha [Candidatus Woesearchaeota archaeon]
MTSISQIKKRDGRIVSFNAIKVHTAIKKAFLANGVADESIPLTLTKEVVDKLNAKYGPDAVPSVENVQDMVENVLIKSNYPEIAKSYILYRQKHKEIREEKTLKEIEEKKLIITREGVEESFNIEKLKVELTRIGRGLEHISIQKLVDETCKQIYPRMDYKEIKTLILNVTKTSIEDHYDYSYMSSRLVLNGLYKTVLGKPVYSDELKAAHKKEFEAYIKKGIELDMLAPELKEFDLDMLADALDPQRDLLFMYLGMQTIYDRYLLRDRSTKKEVYELPQWMWMRVAMGLALQEDNKEKWAIEFYNTLSRHLVVSSTPTLFNSGTTHSQMSSCFINTVPDSLKGIFKTYSDCALLSKWAGGLGTDWTQVRAKGARIKGTNGESQGIIPFVKIYNDVALAVNQGGKRKGAMCAYLEPWHRDIEEFLELRKNTGDERRRAHDIHTAVFISDLFMKRVRNKEQWSLFSPDEAKDLHNAYGKDFEEAYLRYEKMNLPSMRKVNAFDLWKKMLTMLFETGHPWVTFKDPINIRSPQDHVGRVHSSNLCTEITLNTSDNETAVCNLASLNLSKMVKGKALDKDLIKQAVIVAMRMLDNVIDINDYQTEDSKRSNLKHRPVGLGMMGYQDVLYQLEIDFDSDENVELADEITEIVSYYAILGSSKLAEEKGVYQTFKGSKWDRGILPYDTLETLEKERGLSIKCSKNKKLDWSIVKEHIKKHGMRNSNTMAIAPTATISNIAGCTPCIEPTYKNIYMKENMSGNFIVINKYLIDALEKEGLWNRQLLSKIKLNNGSVLDIDEIPASIRRRFKETFEIDSSWIIKAAAERAKWIDQSASTNLFLKTTSGKIISDLYMLAWEYGLKTTYYLRTLAASQVTKTVEVEEVKQEIKACKINDPDCEACQ